MKKSPLFLATALLTVAFGAHAAPAAAPAATAPAPAAGAAATPTPPTFGAAIAGQCVLDEQATVTDSALGKAALVRLNQLKSVVDSELQTTGAAIDAEREKLAASQPTAASTAAQKQDFQAKAEAWSKKQDAFQAKIQQRQQEMQMTQQTVMSYIFQKAIPNVNAVVTQRACATVVSADSLLHYSSTGTNNGQETQTSFTYVNPAMDITSAVIQKMDASGETLPPFDRVSLDRQGAAGAPAAAAAKPSAGAAKPAAPKK